MYWCDSLFGGVICWVPFCDCLFLSFAICGLDLCLLTCEILFLGLDGFRSLWFSLRNTVLRWGRCGVVGIDLPSFMWFLYDD